jgi:phage terminase large subunit
MTSVLAEAVLHEPDVVSWSDAGMTASLGRRFHHLLECSRNPMAQLVELELCRTDVFYWWHWWPWTYDPRNVVEVPPMPSHLPFDLFPRQVEVIKWLNAMLDRREDGVLVKSRDIGFTWMAAGYAWHKWRFVPGFKVTFGSRKAEYVDRLGDPDAIFEKIRLLQATLPQWMLPKGYQGFRHDNHMLLINPDNGNTIRGEGGEEMGRGGRSSLYFIDEASRIEHADRVDAATSANTEVRIWASSINPHNEANLFKRKYTQFPPERVFRFHYSDDPRKTPEWAERKKQSVEPDVWAAEYEIDDTYTVEDIVIPASWVSAAQRIAHFRKVTWAVDNVAHEKIVATQAAAVEFVNTLGLTADARIVPALDIQPAVNGIAGGDVGGGKAKSVFVARFGPIVMVPQSWGQPDTIDTALKMLDHSMDTKILRPDGWECKVKALRFDSIGIGMGVSAAMRRNPRPGLLVTGVNVGEPPSDRRWPDDKTSEEKFTNLKAEGWWIAREAFKKAYETVLALEGKEGGRIHPTTELVVLPDDRGGEAARLAAQLSTVKWLRNESGKILMESKVNMARRGAPSPDHADALILTYTANSKAERWAAFAHVNI